MRPDDESGVQGVGQGELQRLKSREIDIEEYLDEAVLAATAHVSAVLSSERLSAMREILRSQLAQHPDLVALVRELASATSNEQPVSKGQD